MQNRNRLRARALVWIVLSAVAGFASAALAAGPRLAVTVDEPFVIDGERFPAGELSLRPLRNFTPTTTLNEVWVGNRCLGVLMASRTDDRSREASSDAVLFGRDDSGQLVLRGFSYRVDGATERYRYELLDSGRAVATASTDEQPFLIAGTDSR